MMPLSRWAPVAALGSILTGMVDARLLDAQEPARAPAPDIRVHSDLVVLHAVVLDHRSRFVQGLARDQFAVYEDGALQAIAFFVPEDQPATVGLVIDNSGSMHTKRTDVIAAGHAFVRASHPRNELFLVHFNERVWSGLPDATTFTRDPNPLFQALSRTGARGQTALYDAVSRALDHVALGTNHHRVLVVISDGRDNASATRLAPLLLRARQSEAVIYTIGLFDDGSRDRDPEVLRELATATGGIAHFPKSSAKATVTLEQIARDIRSTYTIGFVPTNLKRDGQYRRLRVTVHAPGEADLKVRTRAGYIAPIDPPQEPPSR